MYSHFLNAWLALSFFQLHSVVKAITIQEAIWNSPNGKLSDLSETFTNGVTLGLSWNAYNSTVYLDTTKSLVHLWVTAFDFNLNQYTQLLKENINMTQPGTYSWTVNIPEKNLAASAKYVLRFKQPVATFSTSNGEISSPGFLILRSVSSTTPSAPPTSSATSTTPPTSTSPTSTSPASTSPTSSSSSSSTSTPLPPAPAPVLSTGAKAGIGIGAAVGALAVLSAAALLLLRRRRRANAATAPSSDADTDAGKYPPPLPAYHEADDSQPQMRHSDVRAHELASGQSENMLGRVELPGR